MLPGLLLLFLVVASSGIGLAVLEARGRALPLPVSTVHGALALLGIVLLAAHDIDDPHNHLANGAALVFIFATAGGFMLFAFRATRQKLPLAVVALHAAFALTAVLLLAFGWLRG